VPTASTVGLLRQELADQRRKVDFDTYDVTVDELIRRVGRKRIDIAPVYQRQFRWDKARQSRLIESVLLGIPVPPLFMATNSSEGVQDKWEVVDGLQRLLSLVNFAGDSETRAAASISDGPLVLAGLDKLARFDGCSYTELPEDVQSFLLDRPMKVVVLNDKSQLQVRYDLFERLNTGGITLTPQEIRESVFRGDFMDLLGELATTADFKKVVVLPAARWKDGTPEDYALRFFAFLESYKRFDHSVQDFLTTFVTRAAAEPRVEERRSTFTEAFRFLAGCFPSGLKTRKGQTPVNLYEGVAVGAALALKDRPDLTRPASLDWISSDEMRRLTTGATNSQPRVSGRIEYSRDRFLGRPA
jgi:hypothetical protein